MGAALTTSGPWYHVTADWRRDAILEQGLLKGPEDCVHVSLRQEVFFGDFGANHSDCDCAVYHVVVFEVDVDGLEWEPGEDEDAHRAILSDVPPSRLKVVDCTVADVAPCPHRKP